MYKNNLNFKKIFKKDNIKKQTQLEYALIQKKPKFNNNFKKGFTLVEFIIVMVIIGILILLASPKFLNYVEKAKETQIKNDILTIEKCLLDELFKNNISMDYLTKEEWKINTINKQIYSKEGKIKNKDKDSLYKEDKTVFIDKDYLLKTINTKLKGEFVYIDNEVLYLEEYINKFNKPNIPTKDPWNKYNVELDGYKVNILGLKEKSNKEVNILDLENLEDDGFIITKISKNAFIDDKIVGNFPKLKYLTIIEDNAFKNSVFTGNLNLESIQTIGNNAFTNSEFTGELPNYKNLKYIGWNSLQRSTFSGSMEKHNNLEYIGALSLKNSKFTGGFPKSDNLTIIGNNALEESIFTGTFPYLKNIKKIGRFAFKNSNFDGSFPNLQNLEEIDMSAFLLSNFNNNFPKLNKLRKIGDSAFYNSKFKGPYPEYIKEVYNNAFYKSNFINTPSLSNIDYLLDKEEYIKAYSEISKLPKNMKDKENLKKEVNILYSLKNNKNISSTNNVKHWEKANIINNDNIFKVNAGNSTGGFGIIMDRNINIDYIEGKEYIINFDIKSNNINSLNYNYIISDSGNQRLNNISIKNNNEWQNHSLLFTPFEKDRINASILIGADLRINPKGTDFQIKNIIIKEITDLKNIN